MSTCSDPVNKHACSGDINTWIKWSSMFGLCSHHQGSREVCSMASLSPYEKSPGVLPSLSCTCCRDWFSQLLGEPGPLSSKLLEDLGGRAPQKKPQAAQQLNESIAAVGVQLLSVPPVIFTLTFVLQNPFGDKLKKMMTKIEEFADLSSTSEHGTQSYEQWVIQKEKSGNPNIVITVTYGIIYICNIQMLWYPIT